MQKTKNRIGYPSIDKPWLKYYSAKAIHTDVPQMSIYEYLYKCNKDYMDSYALSYYGNRITFKEMFEKIDAMAGIFLFVGVKAGEIVTVCSVNVPETVYVLYGLNKIGAIANMVDPRTSQNGLLKYVDEVKSKVVVTIDVAYEKFQPILSKLEKIMIISPSDSLRGYKRIGYKLINRQKRITNEKALLIGKLLNTYKATGNIESYYESNQCCVIEHTGGTTGSPKGVMLSNENINAVALQSVLTGIDMRREHNWLDIMPPFIAYGVGMGLHLPLTIGMETILIPKFDAKKFDELLVKYKPIHMVGVPSYWGTIIESEKLKNTDLSYIIAPTVGGDSMDVSLEKRANEFLKEHNCSYGITKGYGMTEVAGGVTGTIDSCNELGSVGIPFVHSVVSVFEPHTDKELTYMEQGEICICGPNVMLGYYDNEDETKQIIKIHKDGKRWVHTGDLGYMTENGSVYILGRAKRLIIRYDGFKVFPSLIENAVMEVDAVKECCAVGKKDEEHSQGMLPIVYAVKTEACLSNKVTNEEITEKIFEVCREKLPEYAQPVECRFIDALPLTPVGKVDYRKLEEEMG